MSQGPRQYTVLNSCKKQCVNTAVAVQSRLLRVSALQVSYTVVVTNRLNNIAEQLCICYTVHLDLCISVFLWVPVGLACGLWQHLIWVSLSL